MSASSRAVSGGRGMSCRRAVFSMGAVPLVDLAGADLLAELHDTLKKRGIEFRLAGTLSEVRELLVKAGYEERCGPVKANEPVAAVVADAGGGQHA